jgi:hypothetical protein
LLDGNPHHIGVLNLQLAHRSSPNGKAVAIIPLCCITYVAAFSSPSPRLDPES